MSNWHSSIFHYKFKYIYLNQISIFPLLFIFLFRCDVFYFIHFLLLLLLLPFCCCRCRSVGAIYASYRWWYIIAVVGEKRNECGLRMNWGVDIQCGGSKSSKRKKRIQNGKAVENWLIFFSFLPRTFNFQKHIFFLLLLSLLLLLLL